MPQHDESPTGAAGEQDTQAAHVALPDSSGQQPEIDTTSAGSHDAQTATLTPEDTQRAEAIDTQRASATGDEAPTELIADRPLPDTVAATAWSQTDDHPDDEHDDGPDVDSEHERSRWPWRWVIGLAAGVFAILAIIATSVAFGGWGLEQHRQTEVEPAQSPSATGPTSKTESTRPKPPIPDDAMLNGQYKMVNDEANAEYKNSTASEWGAPDPEVSYIIFSTRCDAHSCTAISAPSGDNGASGNASYQMSWTNGAWVSAPLPESVGGGGSAQMSMTLYPSGHGRFHGTESEIVVSGPHAGASITVPITLDPY